MVGTARSPMVTTVAPTIPVDAPKRAPTNTTEMARPPFIRPNSSPMVSRRSSASPDLSSMTPMKTNRGTARRVTLVITPQMRKGSRLKNPHPNPMSPNTRAVPMRVKVTGKPAISRMVKAKNIHAGKYSIRNPFQFRRER